MKAVLRYGLGFGAATFAAAFVLMYGFMVLMNIEPLGPALGCAIGTGVVNGLSAAIQRALW